MYRGRCEAVGAESGMTGTPSISVRFAEEADVEWCVLTATFASPEFARQQPGVRELIVAERDGTLVGLLIVDYLWAGLPHPIPSMSFVNVLREHQRLGAGREMLGFTEKHLRRRGHRLLMSSCTVDEPEPQAWHRHVGFQDCGYWAGVPFADMKGEVFFYKHLVGEAA